MLIPQIVSPSKGASPTVVVAQQLLLVRVERKQNAPERLSPVVTPSQVSKTFFIKPLQGRSVNPRAIRQTFLPLVLLTLLVLRSLSSSPYKVRSRRRSRSGGS